MHPQLRLLHQQVGGQHTLRQDDRDDAAEAGIAHLPDRRVVGQAPGELGGVGLGTLDPQVQRAEPAQRQPRLQRPGDRAEEVAPALEDAVQLVVAGRERADQGVAVAREVLRSGVHDEVGPEVEWPLQQGRGERVVHDDVRARVVRGRPDRRDVGDLECRVGRGLQPDQGRVGAGGHHGVGVGDVDQVRAQPFPGLEVGELHDRAVVGVPGGHHHAVASDQVEHRRHRRQTGGEREAAPALEGTERLLERLPGRVAVPAVLQLTAGDVRRRHRDRRVQRGVRDVLGAAGGDGDRGGLQVGRVRRHAHETRPLGSSR